MTIFFLAVIALCAVWFVVKGIWDDLKNDEKYFNESSFLTPPSNYGKEVDRTLEAIRDSLQERDRKEKEKEMAEYAAKKRFQAPLGMRVGGHQGEEMLHDTKHEKAEFLIPQNLTSEERQILKDFYNL